MDERHSQTTLVELGGFTPQKYCSDTGRLANYETMYVDEVLVGWMWVWVYCISPPQTWTYSGTPECHHRTQSNPGPRGGPSRDPHDPCPLPYGCRGTQICP